MEGGEILHDFQGTETGGFVVSAYSNQGSSFISYSNLIETSISLRSIKRGLHCNPCIQRYLRGELYLGRYILIIFDICLAFGGNRIIV